MRKKDKETLVAICWFIIFIALGLSSGEWLAAIIAASVIAFVLWVALSQGRRYRRRR